MYIVIFLSVVAVCALIYKGILIIRPMQRGIVETLGRYARFAEPGIHWYAPIFQKAYCINICEHMVNTDPIMVHTKDNLNIIVDAQVYMQVKADEENVKAALYRSPHYTDQMANLARTTISSIVSTMLLREINNERASIGEALHKTLGYLAADYGIEIVRTELKEIELPREIQQTLNNVVKAEYEKIAAADFAKAAETVAAGMKRADIKKAEGKKRAMILAAEGEVEVVRLMSDAARKYDIGLAQISRIFPDSGVTPKNSEV